MVPASIAALSGILVVGKVVPIWWGWLTVIAAVVSAVGNVLSPTKTYYEHVNAAKNFIAIKHRARALYQTFAASMTDGQYHLAVQFLLQEYTDLIRFAPPTDNKG